MEAEKIYEVAEVHTAETLAIRIKTTVRNTQRIMLDAAISIGQDLIEAKELIEFGEWENWLEHSVGFSSSSAVKYMKISREYGDFSKTELITDLSYTKALALLALPGEDREGFLSDNEVEGMTVKEMEEKIKTITQAKSDTEEDKSRLEEERDKIIEEKTQLAGEVQELKDKISGLEAAGADAEGGISAEAQKEIDKTKKDLEKAEKKAEVSGKKAEKLQEEIDQLKASQDKVVEDAKTAAIEEGKLQGKKENEEALLKQKEVADEAVKARQDAEKKLAVSSNKDLMRISFLMEQLQKTFNEGLEVLENIEVNDKEQAGKLRGGLHAILGQMQERL